MQVKIAKSCVKFQFYQFKLLNNCCELINFNISCNISWSHKRSNKVYSIYCLSVFPYQFILYQDIIQFHCSSELSWKNNCYAIKITVTSSEIVFLLKFLVQN